MDKITTGISYGASGGGAAFWFTRLLDGYSPEQWAAIGVLGGLFSPSSRLMNLYFKIREDRRRERMGRVADEQAE